MRRAVAVARGARAQPVWPRLVGWMCLGLACMVAIDPVGPVPTHVARSSSARPGSSLASPCAIAPDGATPPGAPLRFRWRAGASAPPFSVVVLDQRLDPLLRADGIGAAHWEPDAAAAAVLERAGAFHWYVLGDRDGLPVASALAAVEFGAPGTAVGTVR